MYQQGDVLFFGCCHVPAGKVREDGVVAEGEATGHAHRVIVDGSVARVIEADDGQLYVMASAPVKVTHEEHAAIELPAGVWKVGRVQEYDHFGEEARRVAD